MMSGPYHAARPPVRYLFIDGGYLRGVLEEKSKRFFPGDQIALDFNRFTSGYKKKFYYDCPPPKKAGESREAHEKRIEPQLAFYDQLRSLNGFHVFLGSTSSEGGRARQKGVDIMIAVHMLTHSFRHNMEQVTLLTGDLDFKPLIEALVQDGMDVTLWYEPSSTSKELVYSADSQQQITIDSLLNCFTSEFNGKHPPLEQWSQQIKKVDGCALIRSGVTSTGRKAELFQMADGSSLVITSDANNPGYNFHIKHRDLGFIEKIMEDRQSAITWT